jgi:hypothetical protein
MVLRLGPWDDQKAHPIGCELREECRGVAVGPREDVEPKAKA